MGESPQTFIRSRGGERLVAWEPSTAETRIAAFLESLLTEYPPSQHGPIDLIGESSGKLVGPEVSARTVVNRVLAVHTKYVSDALDQIEALRGQEGPALDYAHEPGSTTIALDPRYPRLVRVGSSGASRVVVRGCHRSSCPGGLHRHIRVWPSRPGMVDRRTVPVLAEDERLVELARPISRARWRLRLLGGLRTLRGASLPAFIGLLGLGALAAAYIGLAVLILRLHEINLPLAP